MTKLLDHDFFKLSSAEMQTYIQRQTNQTLNIIDSSQISVIIQGPVFTQKHALAPQGITAQVIQTLRQHLPHAQLILATWQDQPSDHLTDLDDLVRLTDPGTTNFYRQGAEAANLYNNGNRLIYSTQQGLARVKRPYTLKLRSDLLLFHPMFSAFFSQFTQTDPAWQVFQQRILGFPIYSLKFEQGYRHGKKIQQPRPFHISDWVYFGLSEDMETLFSCPLMQEPETSRWFEYRPKPAQDLWEDRLWRYSPEQYICSQLALKYFNIELQHASQQDADIIEASERFIANNFVVLDQYQWGLYSLKLENFQDSLDENIQPGLYSHAVWQQDYQRYSACVHSGMVV